MPGALVLNATFEPLCIVTYTPGAQPHLAGKAEMISASDQCFRAATVSFEAPSVVRLLTFVRVPYTTRVALNRRAVFAPRQLPLSVLQCDGGKHRPRRASVAGRYAHVGQRRRGVQALQRPQGRPHAE